MPEGTNETPALTVQKSELSNAYDKLNALWNRAEDRIRALMIPCEVRAGISPPINGDPTVYLVWARFGSKWRICYGVEWEGEWAELKPVVDCTVDVRLNSVPFAKQLLETARSQVPATIARVQNAASELASVLDEPQ